MVRPCRTLELDPGLTYNEAETDLSRAKAQSWRELVVV